MTQKRTSKAEWLEKALEVLETDGVNGVKIDRLSKLLETSRSGFYWHFVDRADLLLEMLRYWKHEYTDVVTEGWGHRKDLPSPEEQVLEVMTMIDKFGLNRYEVPVRAWADHDPVAAEFVKQVYTSRLNFVKSIIEQLGFSGPELEMRAQLFLCYLTHGKAMYGTPTKRKFTELAKVCQKLITNKAS